MSLKTKITKKDFELIAKQYSKAEYFYQKDDENNKIILIMELSQDNKKQPTKPNTNNGSNLTPEFFENLFDNLLDKRFGKNNCLLLEEIDQRIDIKIQSLEQRLDKKIDTLNTKVDDGFRKVNERLDKVEQRLDKVEKDIKMLKSFHGEDIEKYQEKNSKIVVQ